MAINTFPRITPLTTDNFVGREIQRRKTKTYGANQKPRTVWVRAVSNAIQLSSPDIVGNLNVLVGGLLSKSFYTRGAFETLYKRAGRQITDKPIPGIDSVSITSKGELQSLRKLQLNWTCPNLQDLDDLAPYWLTPGVSVWVEWGWGQLGVTPRQTVIKGEAGSKKLKDYYEDGTKIYDELVTNSGGNQDGVIGVITNFTYNQNDDGSWTCMTELTSMGQTLLALDLNKDKIYKNASLDDLSNKQKTENIKEFINGTFSEAKLSKLPNPAGGNWKDTKDVLYITKENFLWDDDLIFVSWRFVEEEIVNHHASLTAKGQGGEVRAFYMDSEDILISNDPLLFTTDANVGLVVHTPGNGAFSFDNGLYSGHVRNLYINSKLIKDTFNNSETLEEALMKLLREISGACGDIWNFKLQPKPLAENVLQVIDVNYVAEEDLTNTEGAIKNNSIISFGGYSGDSILTSVSFTSKLTDQLAMKYFVGRNKSDASKDMIYNDDNDGGVKPIFGGFVDRVLMNLDPPPTPALTDDQIKEQLETSASLSEKNTKFSITLEKFKSALANGPPSTIENTQPGWPTNVVILEEESKEFLVEYLNRDNQLESGKNRIRQTPLYPLEISVGIDGIAGILPGHCFVLDNVPKLYKKTGVFQVVEVGHDISADDWTTNLRCFFRYILPTNKPQGDRLYSIAGREGDGKAEDGEAVLLQPAEADNTAVGG